MAKREPERYKLFAVRYLVHLNAAKAAEEVGYSAKSARYRGMRLMKNPTVAAYIAKEMERRAERNRIEADATLSELSPLAFSDISHYELDEQGNVTLAAGAPPGAMRAVSRIKRKVRIIPRKRGEEPIVEYDTELALWDKNSALEKVMSHLGLLRKRFEHTGKDGAPLPTAAPQVILYIPNNYRDGSAPAPLPGNRIAQQLGSGPG